jgi:hypothetical protein
VDAEMVNRTTEHPLRKEIRSATFPVGSTLRLRFNPDVAACSDSVLESDVTRAIVIQFLHITFKKLPGN